MGFKNRIFISAESFAMDSSNPSPRGGAAVGRRGRGGRNITSDLSDSFSSTEDTLCLSSTPTLLPQGAWADDADDNDGHPVTGGPAAGGGCVAQAETFRSEEECERLSPLPDGQELSHEEIFKSFDNSPQLVCFGPLVAAILGFWMLLPVLREKVIPPVLKKILGLITDEHKPALPEKTSRQAPKPLFQVGTRYPHRYTKLLGVLRRYGVMGFDLRNLTNIIVGLLFGTLNPFLVSNIQQVDIMNKEVKTTLVFTLMFLSAVMRKTVLVKKPAQLYSFVKLLLEKFNRDDSSWIDQIDETECDSDFVAAVKVVFAKVFTDFTSIPEGKALTDAQLAKFHEELNEFALPDADDKTNQSQKIAENEIPEVLVEAYERHWFALQNLVPRLLLSRGEPLFEFTGKTAEFSHFFLFLTLLTSSCRKSANIFQKELEKVLRAFQEVKTKQQRLHVFGKDFETPASKLFILIRLVFLEESDDFIARFFEFDSEGKKLVKTPTSLSECLFALVEKMHKIAKFSSPVYNSIRQQITAFVPNASAAASGGVCAHEGLSFRPGQPKKSALKQPSAPATASPFTQDALRAHSALQANLAQQLVDIGLTSPDASMALAGKFNEAGVSDLKRDLKGLSREDVADTLKTVSVTLSSVQLNKIIKHVAEN